MRDYLAAGRCRWSDIQRLGLAAGAVFFFALFFDPVLEFAGKIGSSVVGIEFAVFLLIIRRRVVVHPTVILPKTALGPKLPSPTPTI